MKILVIEDDTLLGEALKIALKKTGYTADVITSGEEGWERVMIHHSDYDAVVLDLSLPEMNGEEICRRAREHDVSLPILILTGDTTIDSKVSILNKGADDYLTKPFSMNELIARLRALMRRPSSVLSSTLYVRDIQLDTISRIVTRNGKPLQLTLKEFGILEYLMRAPGQVVIRDRILDHVWDFNFTGFSNIVDVHINGLRKKLGGKEEEDIIETVRGVGYKMRA